MRKPLLIMPLNGHDVLLLFTPQAFRYCHVGIIAAKEPFQVEVVEGKKYSWCKCGLSKKQV